MCDVKNKYENLMLESIEQYRRENPTELINSKWECIKQSIKTATENIPKLEKKTKQKWMTEEILNKMAVRKATKNITEYKEIDKEIRNMCRQAKIDWLESRCKNIEDMNRNNKTIEMHKEIKTVSKRKQLHKGGCIKNKQGEIIFDEEEKLQRWTEYVKELFDDDRGLNPQQYTNEGPRILKSEVAQAMKTMQKGKATGLDNISLEMIDALEDFGIERITELCNNIYDTGYLPEDMKTSEFITLPKKSKAIECSDHRTISLMSHVTKILLKIIQERIKNRINNEISEEQFGFRPKSGTREAIFCIRTIIEKYIEAQKDIYICFIDYSKAFDRVQHEKLITTLTEIGLDGKDLRLISNLYWEQRATVRCDKKHTPTIDIKRGVRQGCVLSPSLFNIYTEKIFREIQETPGIKIQGRDINNIRYADDTVLIAENEQQLQDLVEQVNNKSKECGLDINIEKTKTMIISKTNEKPTINININGQRLEQVKSMVYLGHTITEDGKCDTEIKKRIGMAKSVFNNMKQVITSTQLPMKLKQKIIKCYVHSTFLYGAETWTLNKQLENKIEAFEMWLYRRMGRISWKQKLTNRKVLEMLGAKQELLIEIKQRQLRYFGHIKRHNTLLKTLLEGKVEGKRARGRPRQKWEDNIKRWTGNTLEECTNNTRDRKCWRSITANLRCGDGTLD